MRSMIDILKDVKDAMNMPGQAADRIIALRQLEATLGVRDALVQIAETLHATRAKM